ncbi:hypothetical protein HFP72_33215 [Nocardiopsis sp. ARC36]
MNARTRPSSVTAVLVLLILITLYQLGAGGLALLGGFAAQAAPSMPTATEVPAWAIFVAAAVALMYGAASLALTVMVARGRPAARPAALGVNAVYGVGILALAFTPVAGFPELVAAAFAFTVIALLYSGGARAYFAGSASPAAPGTLA